MLPRCLRLAHRLLTLPHFQIHTGNRRCAFVPPTPPSVGGKGWGLGDQTHVKCNDVDQKSFIFLRDFACFFVGCRAGSTRQQNEFKTTCAVGNCFPVIAWLRRPSNETRPHLHAWQALRGCFISQATLAVAQLNRQEKQLHNCTAILCSCPISLPLFPQHPLQAKSAKHASMHQPNAQQGWAKLSRTFHQGRQGQPNTASRAHGAHVHDVH